MNAEQHRPEKHSVPARTSTGFTLVEIMIATVLVGTALVSASWAMSAAARTRHALGEQPLTAVLVAKEINELAQSLPKQPSGTTGVTSGADVVALDSLDGAVFSPPIAADRSTQTDLSGWTQIVDVAIESLDATILGNGSIQIDPDKLKGTPNVYALTVTILQDGVEVDTFKWWIAP